MKPQNVVVIDPVTATVTERVWAGHLSVLYGWARCNQIQVVRAASNGLLLWVDEDGRAKAANTARWFHPKIWPQIIIGVGIVTGRIGRDVPPNLKDEIGRDIKWGLLMGRDGPAAPGTH